MLRSLIILSLLALVGMAPDAAGGDGCDVSCPRGAALEGEPCGANANGNCFAATPFEFGQPVCGSAWANGGARDFDWYRFEIDSAMRVTVTGMTELPIIVLVATCSDFPSSNTVASAAACTSFEGTACLGPGEWWIIVFPVVTDGFPCGSANDYWFALAGGEFCTHLECGDPGTESCYVPHETSACDLPECCQTVCAVDQLCCEVDWDAICAAEAFKLCIDPPRNDVCAGATVITEGDTLFSTYAALVGPALSEPCGDGGATSMPHDIWFAWTATRTGLTSVSSCDDLGSVDTRIGVHAGECASYRLVGCVDNPNGCSGSEATFLAVCGETYLIQVGTEFWLWQGTLMLDSLGAPCCGACTGDVNDDGTVDAADLAVLLGNWSSADGCSDLDESGAVDAADLAVLLGAWGACR